MYVYFIHFLHQTYRWGISCVMHSFSILYIVLLHSLPFCCNIAFRPNTLLRGGDMVCYVYVTAAFICLLHSLLLCYQSVLRHTVARQRQKSSNGGSPFWIYLPFPFLSRPRTLWGVPNFPYTIILHHNAYEILGDWVNIRLIICLYPSHFPNKLTPCVTTRKHLRGRAIRTSGKVLGFWSR